MNRNSKKSVAASNGKAKILSPVKRGFLVGLFAVVSLILLHLLRPLSQTLLLIFTGILFAVFLDGLANFIKDRTPISRGWALGLTLITLVLFFGGIIFMVGTPIAGQLSELIDVVPKGIDNMMANIKQTELGRRLLKNGASGAEQGADILPSSEEVVVGVTGALSVMASLAGSLVVVLFIGIYAASNPHVYINNGVRLFPQDKRARVGEVLNRTGKALRRWLLGQLTAMVTVGILTAIGLSIIGMKLILALAFLAMLFSFIPFVGPIIAFVPAVLVGLLDSPAQALHVGIVYLVVQTIESYLITPIIQQRAVSFPPAFLISMQVLMGVLFGPLGLLLATPLTVVAIVLIQTLYVEDVLDDSLKVLGEAQPFKLPESVAKRVKRMKV